jgi:hypothetical protein
MPAPKPNSIADIKKKLYRIIELVGADTFHAWINKSTKVISLEPGNGDGLTKIDEVYLASLASGLEYADIRVEARQLLRDLNRLFPLLKRLRRLKVV